MAKPQSINELLESGTIKKGNDPELEIVRIPSGIELLDELIGGGVPRGRFMQLYGPESTGKTLICQYIAAAIQQTEQDQVLYVDLENTFDARWWGNTGVDMERLTVTSPPTGEIAVDIMLAMLRAEEYKLGLIILDSLAGLIPSAEIDPTKSTGDNRQPGAQAQLITRMYGKLKAEMGTCTVIMTNQMRESIGQAWASEMDALPGGRANRHYCHITLRTRREGWINSPGGNNHTGFTMEIISKKNKTCSVPDGTSILLPFDASNQIDMIITYANDAVEKKIITRAGPYFRWGEERWLGQPVMRQWFREHPEAVEALKLQLYHSESIDAGQSIPQ